MFSFSENLINILSEMYFFQVFITQEELLSSTECLATYFCAGDICCSGLSTKDEIKILFSHMGGYEILLGRNVRQGLQTTSYFSPTVPPVVRCF